MATIALALIAAVLVQPLVFVAHLVVMLVPALVAGQSISANDVEGVLIANVYVLLVAAAFVLLLGLPLFLVLKRLNKLSWLSLASAGFGAAALPYAIFLWPLRRAMPGFSSGGNWYGQYFDFVKDGEYTIYGWLNYAEGILWFGIHGLAGAMVFYRVWLTRSESKPGASANESRPAGTPRG